MSVLVVGISHKTAPVALLDQLALDGDGVAKLLSDAAAGAHVAESTVVATCNRLEIYAVVDRFHGSVEELSRLLLDRADEPAEALLPHLYVHYDDGAVSHLFQVASGLDSMAVGEGQILGQTRDALRLGQEGGTVGPVLNSLFQQALRVGKRAHAETDIDRAAPSLVSAALEAAAETTPVAGARVLVLGAGSMASLAVAAVTRSGAVDVVIVNRTAESAERLAAEYAGRVAPLAALGEELAVADLVIACTGSADLMVTPEMLPRRPLTLVDLALPHDIDPAVGALPGVRLVNLALLGERLSASSAGQEVEGVRSIVAQEVSAYLTARRQASVTPTVVALRTMATGLVDAELERLDARLPELDPALRREVAQAMSRLADKLLHQPTVRVKELADEGGAVSYAAALAELFALDPDAVEAVTRPVVTDEASRGEGL
ncbi:glutamyl-tRNA reductase [Nocardioides sp.]|uniref:glutamyl-tRNA reductase n=1 Tax=Nocardioides sp. TaxID=35761 RepID=UPI003528A72F